LPVLALAGYRRVMHEYSLQDSRHGEASVPDGTHAAPAKQRWLMVYVALGLLLIVGSVCGIVAWVLATALEGWGLGP
jgi:hypothetical protein